jgi:Na+-driven multidrug efflux pump
MVSGTITNIVLDYYLIAVLGMGVQGAAIATGASQILPVITMVFVILKNSGWTFKWPKFHGKDIRDILFNGSSELLSNITLAVSGAVINIVILNRVGTDGVAAYAVAMQVASFAASIGYGFSEASQSAISYNLGTGQGDRVVNFLRMTVKVNMVTGVLFCVMAFTLGTPLSRIFVTDAATIAMAAKILRYYGIAFLFMGSNITFGTYYTAINDPIRSGGITLYRSIIAIAAGLWIFPLVFGSIGIWITIIFAEISTFFVGLHMVRNKPFGRNRLPAHQN